MTELAAFTKCSTCLRPVHTYTYQSCPSCTPIAKHGSHPQGSHGNWARGGGGSGGSGKGKKKGKGAVDRLLDRVAPARPGSPGKSKKRQVGALRLEGGRGGPDGMDVSGGDIRRDEEGEDASPTEEEMAAWEAKHGDKAKYGRTQKPRPLGDTFRSPGSSKFNPNKYHSDDLDPKYRSKPKKGGSYHNDDLDPEYQSKPKKKKGFYSPNDFDGM